MSKVTDALIELTELARKRDESYHSKLEALRSRHVETAHELLGRDAASGLVSAIERDFADIREVLRGIWLVRSCSERIVELVSGHGELWSAQFLDAYLRSQGVDSTWLDARSTLVVEPRDNGVVIDWETSRERVRSWLPSARRTVVITGFVASTPDGIATTLKRNGSDYSASIFGDLLDASAITIWTDVDGVLSADPRLVPEAVVLGEMSYDEATELAYFGAKVVHPSTMAPAIRKRIPIWIRNTFNPSCRGTLIHDGSREGRPTAADLPPIKGFSTIDSMALVNVEGTGMMGVPGVAQRLFGALREVGVSVVMISQASSEHSICFAIPRAQAELARKTVEQAFFAELHHGQIQTIDVSEACSILAAVGDGMAELPGVSGKFFTALGRAAINVRAIAQGSSERNISVVIDQAEARRALRAVHSAFYLSNQTLSIGLVGPGLIGGTLLEQLSEAGERLRAELRIDLRVRAILSSRRMLLQDAPIELAGWKKALEDGPGSAPADYEAFASHVYADHIPHAVIVDATASAEIPEKHYVRWLERGIHIVSPNKKANSGSMALYQSIRRAARARNRHYLYSTTVGAGLPVISTLRDLVRTGDRIQQVEGILSGTLSYIFHSFGGDRPFSEIVKDARNRGFTEPDPRDDLSGADVARKLVILAREIGIELELQAIPVRNLVPEALRAGTIDEYLRRLPEHDREMADLAAQARRGGQVLRYVGVITAEGKASVELRPYPLEHPFARIAASDNIVAFRTQRYSAQPLIIQGPGAGPQVTAAGVFADLLRLASFLGGSQ